MQWAQELAGPLAIMAVFIVPIALISFAMTSDNPKVRLIGCRTAASIFALFGVGVAVAAMTDAVEGGRQVLLFAGLLFVAAGWQWRQSTKPLHRR